MCSEHGISFDGKMEKPTTDYSTYPFFSQDTKKIYSPRALFIDTDPTLINEIKYVTYRKFLNPNQLISGKESCASNVNSFKIYLIFGMAKNINIF